MTLPLLCPTPYLRLRGFTVWLSIPKASRSWFCFLSFRIQEIWFSHFVISPFCRYLLTTHSLILIWFSILIISTSTFPSPVRTLGGFHALWTTHPTLRSHLFFFLSSRTFSPTHFQSCSAKVWSQNCFKIVIQTHHSELSGSIIFMVPLIPSHWDFSFNDSSVFHHSLTVIQLMCNIL